MIKSIANKVLFKYHPLVMELFSIMLCVLWGFWLILPPDTFATSETYSTMKQVSPDYIWGIFILSVGLFQSFSFKVNNIVWRTRTMITSTAFWAFVAAMFIASNWATTGVPAYLTVTVFFSWAVIRLITIRNLTQ